MITNQKTPNKFQCSCDIFKFTHQVQKNTLHFKNFKNENEKFFDKKSIQKSNGYSTWNKLSLSKIKRFSETDKKYQRKQKPSYFTMIPSTTKSHHISNSKNQNHQYCRRPKKAIEITKINNLLNQFKTKYDALSKKINMNNKPKIFHYCIPTKLNYPFCLSRTLPKSILKKQNRFSCQSKTYEKQSCEVITSPNLQNSKSVQNFQNLKLRNMQYIPQTSFTLRSLNSKASLNQLCQYQQNNLKVSIEMIIQNDKNLNIKKFPLSQTVLSQNDVLSYVEQNESIQQSIIIGTFKQFPALLQLQSSKLKDKQDQNYEPANRLLQKQTLLSENNEQ